MEKNSNSFELTKTEAYLHALTSVAKNIASGEPHLRDWSKAKIAGEPLSIYDINGSLLFYDFDVYNGKAMLGTIRAAATRLLGSPVISYRLGPRKWDEAAAYKKITAAARKNYGGYKITTTLLVCYSYPKIGLLVTLQSANNQPLRVIFDIADYSVIPVKEAKLEYEGAFAWSFLDSLGDKLKKANLKKFAAFDKKRPKVKYEKGGLKELKKYTIDKLIDIRIFTFRVFIRKELQFCTHYNYNETGSHHCFILHAQQVNDYCAVATAQMILCYYRYYFTQDQIAPACGYNPGGGCPPDQSPGYESLSNNHIDARFDNSATWEEARDEINLLHPMKSGIPGHARACAGYSFIWELFSSNKEKKLFIYDPWPWSANLKAGGDIYWEDWDSVNHTNFVYTKLDY
jgi:hypothetical protein